MKRINFEKYRIENRSPLRSENISFTRSTSSSLAAGIHCSPTRRPNVTKKHEKIKLTQKYRILGAHDPNTSVNYDLAAMLELNLLNKATSEFTLPSTGASCPVDEAIQLGYVKAELIDECIESFNETYELLDDTSVNQEHISNSIEVDGVQ